jgi:hypothetical protein
MSQQTQAGVVCELNILTDLPLNWFWKGDGSCLE